MIPEFFRRYIPIELLMMWVAVIGVCGLYQKASFSEDELSMHKVLLLSGPTEKMRSVAYEAVCLSAQQELLLYIAKDTAGQYAAGDVIVCRTQIEQGRAYVRPGESAWIESRSAGQIGWTEGKLRYVALRVREALEKRLEAHVSDEKNVALIESLLLGDRRKLHPDQRYAFQDAGAMHVLAVSGLHVGIIVSIVMWLLTLGGKVVIRWENYRLRRLQKWAAVLMIWGYAFLTGLSVSVMRSALMFSLLPLGKMHEPSPYNYNRLAAAALIILLINPTALVSPSFLLSFSAVLAILYFCPRWMRYLPHLKADNKAIKLVGYIEMLLLMSLAAQIGTLPFTLLFFGQSANWFFLTNMLVLPLAELALMPLGIAALISAFLPFDRLTSLLMWLTDKAAWLMNASVSWVQQLPGATTFFTFTPLMCALLVGFIITVSAFMRLGGRRKWAALLIASACLTGLLFVYRSAIR